MSKEDNASKNQVGLRNRMPSNFEKTKDVKGTLKRVWLYMSKYKLLLLLVVVFVLLYVICSMATSLMLTPIVDDYIAPLITSDTPEVYRVGLLKMLLILTCLAVGTGIFQYIQSRIMIYVSQNTVAKMRTDLFAKLEKLPINYLDKHKSGDLMSRVTNDLDNVSFMLNNCFNKIIQGFLTIILSLAFMFIISPILTFISLLMIPVILFIVKKVNDISRKQFVKQQNCLGAVNSFVEEHLSSQKVVKAFNREEKVKDNFNEVNEKLKKEGFKAQAYAAIVMPLMNSISNINMAITCVFAGVMTINGSISIGNIVTFIKIDQGFIDPFIEVAQQFNLIQAGLAGAERMFQIIDEDVENFEVGEKIRDVYGHIEFKNVKFSYNKDIPVIKGISFEVQPGEVIAVVGPTGNGKTTIINLLTRFYDIDSGEILLDGKNIKDINKQSLRNILGVVLQDTVLFSDTVNNNIRFGKLDATDEEIEKVAKFVSIDKFIERLPERYNTLLSEDATNISVGQRQLINIARVVLNDPKILVLDEATSNVDTRTEIKIQEAMTNLLKGRTSIVIAHRLSTIRNADKILVINDGQILEAGTHNELIAKRGSYFEMYNGMFNEPIEE